VSERRRRLAQSILDRTDQHEDHVRLATDGDRLDTVELVVVHRDDELDEIDLDRRILGYIQQAGSVFVALLGERLDRAEECGQSLLWDRAAAYLVLSARPDQASSAARRE
jgi:hypothetical protein